MSVICFGNVLFWVTYFFLNLLVLAAHFCDEIVLSLVENFVQILARGFLCILAAALTCLEVLCALFILGGTVT